MLSKGKGAILAFPEPRVLQQNPLCGRLTFTKDAAR